MVAASSHSLRIWRPSEIMIYRYLALLKDYNDAQKYTPKVPLKQPNTKGDMLQQTSELLTSVTSSLFDSFESKRMWHHFVFLVLCPYMTGCDLLAFVCLRLFFVISGDEAFAMLYRFVDVIARWHPQKKIWDKACQDKEYSALMYICVQFIKFTPSTWWPTVVVKIKIHYWGYELARNPLCMLRMVFVYKIVLFLGHRGSTAIRQVVVVTQGLIVQTVLKWMYKCRCILMGNRRCSLAERVIYHAKDGVNIFLFYLNVPT